eukprot:gene8230-7205_t
MGPPCTVWSKARRRISKEQKLRDQAAARPVLRATARLARRVMRRGGAFVIEHPETSEAWRERPFARLARMRGVRTFVLDQCRFGLRAKSTGKLVRKPTKLLSNRMLTSMARRCCPACRARAAHGRLSGTDCRH